MAALTLAGARIDATTVATANISTDPGAVLTLDSGATWDLAGFNETVGSIAGAIRLGAAALTAGGGNAWTSLSGVAPSTWLVYPHAHALSTRS